MQTKHTTLNADWTLILEDATISRDLSEKGHAIVDTDYLRVLPTQKDARLLLKMDTKKSRPPVLAERKLAVWPLTNSSFVILHENASYIDIDPKQLKGLKQTAIHVNEKDPIVSLQSLSAGDITSEQNLVLIMQNARVMALIHQAQNGNVVIAGGGRHRSPKEHELELNLPTLKQSTLFSCRGVQFEIDALHESEQLITMAEAKILDPNKSLSQFTSLHLRQIMFPTLWLHNKLKKEQKSKTIMPAIVLARENLLNGTWDIFWLPVALELNAEHGLSSRVAWERALCLVLTQSTKKKERQEPNTLNRIPIPPRPERASFPQFNMMGLIDKIAINIAKASLDTKALNKTDDRELRAGNWKHLCSKLTKISKPVYWEDAISDVPVACVPRQHHYIRQALYWLGFIEEWDPKSQRIQPTALGIVYGHSDRDIQLQILCNALSRSPLARHLIEGKTFDDIPAQDFESERLVKSTSTAKRRAQSMEIWVKWLGQQIRMHPNRGWCNVPSSWTFLPPLVSF